MLNYFKVSLSPMFPLAFFKTVIKALLHCFIMTCFGDIVSLICPLGHMPNKIFC